MFNSWTYKEGILLLWLEQFFLVSKFFIRIKKDGCVRVSADGGGLSLADELFSVDGASHVLTFGGKHSFSPDIA